jgi:hypothetical protein
MCNKRMPKLLHKQNPSDFEDGPTFQIIADVIPKQKRGRKDGAKDTPGE